MKRIALSDLRAGCVTSPYEPGPGRLIRRRVWYLDDLAPDIDAAGAALWWANLPSGRTACCDLPSRSIYLNPCLYAAAGPRLRRAITHELVHVTEGRSCEECVRASQWARYGWLLVPAWAA